MILLVQNDTKPDLLLRLRSGGKPVPLDGVESITFSLRKPSGAVIDKPATVFGLPANGQAAVPWGTGDLDEAGDHVADVVIVYTGGARQTSKYAIPVYVREKFQENV
jgi:hypothetical protein